MTPEQQRAFTQMQQDIEAMRAELASLRELVNGSADPELEAALDEYLAEKEQKQ